MTVEEIRSGVESRGTGKPLATICVLNISFVRAPLVFLCGFWIMVEVEWLGLGGNVTLCVNLGYACHTHTNINSKIVTHLIVHAMHTEIVMNYEKSCS